MNSRRLKRLIRMCLTTRFEGTHLILPKMAYRGQGGL